MSVYLQGRPIKLHPSQAIGKGGEADSYQFGGFLCRVFTANFVDPLHCDRQTAPLALNQPHSESSDWYAFAALLLQSLLCVGPYGGVHKPADPRRKVAQAARPLQRLTIFHAEVKYPKPAFPYTILPDELLHYFHLVFERDQRSPFPLALLADLTWQTCPRCHLEHARASCPVCAAVPVTLVALPRQTAVVRGRVTSTIVFRTTGTIVAAAAANTQLSWLVWEAGEFKREDGRAVFSGRPGLQFRFVLHGTTTIVCQGGQAIALHPERAPERLAVETCAGQPQIASNGCQRVWLHQGQLWRDGCLGPEYVGDVLANQTRIWLGPTFGFGFYRAGRLSVAFTFSPERAGLNDRVALELGNGQLLEATCVFGGDRAWFLWRSATPTGTLCRAAAIDARGAVLAQQSFDPAQTPWLAHLGGPCAVGPFLFAATDEGITRSEVQQGQLAATQTFPDAEPLVDAATQLLPGADGLYAVSAQQIQHLQMASSGL